MKKNSDQAAGRAERLRAEEKKRLYEEKKAQSVKLFSILFGAAAILSAVALILALTLDAVYIHNTGLRENGGREVAVSGAAFLKALFTGNFSSPDAGYDDLAVPFHYYAGAWCTPAAVFVLLFVLFAAMTLLLSGLGLFAVLKKRDFRLCLFTLGASALSLLSSTALYAICLSMKNSRILPIYCSGNPACSIQSDLLFCVLLFAAVFAVNLFAFLKYLSLERARKASGR